LPLKTGHRFSKEQTSSDKGHRFFFLVREREGGTSLFSMYQERVLALCFLGNAFCQWEISFTSSKEGKIARG